MQANPKQLQAINKIDGPLLILAGAGSGKTATLTMRVENMINLGISPSSILMVTFTNKAALEMKERVAKKLGTEIPRTLFNSRNFPTIGTFHSIGIFFLKTMLNPKNPLTPFSGGNLYEEISEYLGLKKDFVIYDEQDKFSVLKSIIKTELNLDEKEYPARQIAFYISNAKNALISAKAYEKEIDNSLKQVVWEVYTKYEKKLQQNNALDFDDILIKTLKLLKIPKVLEYYHEKYKYIMIDEYQDTNVSQYEIVKLLASKYRNLAVVGDDSQSIYSWRGANLQNILNFKKDYPEAEVIKLEQNYRSTKNVIAGANAVIKNNNTGIKKELFTENETGEKITLIEAPDDRLEAKIIAEIIKDKSSPPPSPLLTKEGENGKAIGGGYSDNLILYRTNSQSRVLEEALLKENIPYKVIGGLKFYDRKEIKDLIAYLKVIFNNNDIVSLKRIINIPTRKIGAKTIEILDNYSNNFGISYFDIIENIDDVEELKPMAKNSLLNFYKLIKDFIKYSKENDVADLLKYIVKKTDYLEFLTQGLSEEEKNAKKENIDELINVASEYNGMENSLSTFLEEIALITDMDKKDETEKDYVTLMTIHTSKGLEQNRVFVCGLEDGLFPSFRSIGDNQALEEERRLMYVAMTRAKKELYLSRAKERFNFGDYVRNPVSRFLEEVPKELLQEYKIGNLYKNNNVFGNSFKLQEHPISNGAKIVKKVANNDISQFARGDKVSHPKFGNGIITSLSGEIAEIAFSGVGVKKMNIRIAPVRKI